MHFVILKENLNKVLSLVGRYISNRPQLPILSNILIKTEGNLLKISATNLELGIIYTLGAKIEKEGETTIPGRLINEFVSSLTTDKVEFILEGTNLIVKTNKTHASFATASPADFPSFPSFNQSQKTFPLNKLKEAILRTVFAASTDEMRPVLTGVKTTIKNGRITFIATDGYRLSIEQTAFPNKQEELQTILPAQSLLEIVRAATEVKAEEVGFSIIETKNQAVFTLPNIQIFTRLIDGEFPNIEKIIPIGFKTKVIVDKEQLTQAVKTTSLFARGAANIVKIKVEKERLRLKAVTPQLGEEEDQVEAKIEGEEVEIAFNFRFLLDLLANFPDKELVLEASGPLAPGVFKPVTSPSDGGSFLHLIMPVRVQG